ncbi:MAG: bifunctional (p)ppGpp synthetase/guanosine-3',5'-bis(diphosphate) 3'-pyrophosphohydrolase [Rhizobiaceae bacterium]|nr:bifunctional (p)ppGpp synthetase/guanosine-3',5'-bis(diphosphate) 3'-pyrophosphohydrolase [Rhizobiaceae bacterium]
MMRQYELVERVAAYTKEPDEALLNKAYVYAMQKHGEQKRASGDPYFSHPLEVAAILTDLKLDEDTIAVGLLHDTIEDTDATRREIDEMFGEKIGRLVEGLTKLKRLDLVSKQAKQAENLRRLLLAISDDIRVLLVKLADRLHNMRTLGVMRPEKSKRIATETMEIYAPLAGRMGMQDLRDELEELSFRYINPEAYETVMNYLRELGEKNRSLTAEISKNLEQRLAERDIQATVKSRQKKPYSVFRKMETKQLGLEQLSDIFGFRVIVNTIEDCYLTLGIVHTDWAMVPGRFKDFISVPKQNDYQSIHTTIVGPSKQRVELQIRTWQMHEVAEYGIAAHSAYKEGDDDFSQSKAYASLRKTIEQLAESDNPEEFLEHTKLELFLDQVFCFTPKGQIISLPTGATPIDFAYAVHTDIGDSCIGCKLNGKIMPVITELQNGDEVEIIRSDSQSPPAAWQSVVVTGKARSAIRRASRQAARKQYLTLGVRILEREFSKVGLPYDHAGIEAALPRLARDSMDDMFAQVGRGEIKPVDVIMAVHPEFEQGQAEAKSKPAAKSDGPMGLFSLQNLIRKSSERSSAVSGKQKAQIPIRGVNDDLPIQFSPECGAVPGDQIIGILDPGKGITVYPAEATALAKFRGDKEHWIDLSWDIEEAKSDRFPARIRILAKNEPGTLADVAKSIASHNSNIQNLNMQVPVDDFAEIEIDLEVSDLVHLTRILQQLSAQKAIAKAERLLG